MAQLESTLPTLVNGADTQGRATRIGELQGWKSGLKFTAPVRVIAHIGYATNAAADPQNSAPTLKALIDGMTLAGVWADDSSDYLIGPDYRRDTTKAPRGHHTVRLEITPADPLEDVAEGRCVVAAQIHFIRTDRGEQPRPEWLTHVAIQDAKHDAKCAYCALIRAQKGGQN